MVHCVSVGHRCDRTHCAIANAPSIWVVTDWQDGVYAAQIEFAREAVELVAADILASTLLVPPSWQFRTEDDGAVRVAYFSHFAPTTLMGVNRADLVVEVADFMQDEVIEDLHGPWPSCPAHDKGGYAQIANHKPVRFCRFGGHVIAAIGQLSR
jgi:hypothetical protein